MFFAGLLRFTFVQVTRGLKMESKSFIFLLFMSIFGGIWATYKEGDLVKIAEGNERHIGIVEKVILDGSGKVTACQIRMTDGSLETVTKSVTDTTMTSYTPDEA